MEINFGDQMTASKKTRKLFNLYSYGLIEISENVFTRPRVYNEDQDATMIKMQR